MKGCQALPGERCGKCKYFCQHYGRTEKGGYCPMRLGHCTHPRLKDRWVEECCQHFTPLRKAAEKSDLFVASPLDSQSRK